MGTSFLPQEQSKRSATAKLPARAIFAPARASERWRRHFFGAQFRAGLVSESP